MEYRVPILKTLESKPMADNLIMGVQMRKNAPQAEDVSRKRVEGHPAVKFRRPKLFPGPGERGRVDAARTRRRWKVARGPKIDEG